MKTVLFVTVGGSPQPLITAIETLKPDRVIFICSDGPKGSITQVIGSGTPCEIRRGSDVINRLPNIPTHTQLGERFNPQTDVVRLANPDDFAEGYRQISTKMAEVRQQDPTAQIKADYTGGTKTMSVCLALAALDIEATLMLTTGDRTDLIKVNRGEMTEQASFAPVVVQRVMERDIPPLLAQFNYSAVIMKLKRLLVEHRLPPTICQHVRSHRDLSIAFDAWDRFDHLLAWDCLQPFMSQHWVQPLGLFLNHVIASRAAIDPTFDCSQGSQGHGYEIVEDLLLNAERRAMQGRFDDAVGRIYRALELLAQVRLKREYGIETGNVELSQLPEILHPLYPPVPRGKVQLALRKSYELLAQLDADILGILYQERQSLIADALQVRNQSLFAHGFQPITQAHYQDMQGSLIKFMQDALTLLTAGVKKTLTAQQFPLQFQFESCYRLEIV